MIDVKGLTKYYGNKVGVTDINFHIERGEAVGLLGPNGAGKTTIMKMIAGHMLPSSGSIEIDGIDAIGNAKEVAKKIGFLTEIPPLYPDMDVEGYLNFIAEIKGVEKSDRNAHIVEVLDLAAIEDVKGRLIRNLSKGYRQRVGLAQALIGNPSVLILDEPTVGLDPKQITEVRKLIRRLSQTRTILLSTHILSEIKEICSRIIIINSGRLILEDSIQNLENAAKNFVIWVKGKASTVGEILLSVNGVKSVKPILEQNIGDENTCRFMVVVEDNPTVREEIFNQMASRKLPILEIRSLGISVEEIFLEVTS
jgi:ABC-2 type transport system ATP-binding protein